MEKYFILKNLYIKWFSIECNIVNYITIFDVPVVYIMDSLWLIYNKT